jgi:hypothetical protein
MQTLFAITHRNKDGLRTLTFTNTGHNHFGTRDVAEAFMRLCRSQLFRVIGDAVDTLAVREIECYDHGDSVATVFAD